MRRLTRVWMLAVMVAACGGGTSTSAADTPSVDVLVSAAASLTDAFGAVEEAFERDHADVDIVLNLGGSSALREQILEGAPVDVFASANEATMRSVVEAGKTVDEPRVFATNRIEIAVPAGNPAGVRGLEDFTRPELFIGMCAEGVPCGDFGRQVLQNAGVVPSIDSNEPDVRFLLTKIAAGELDAGLTYVTDIASGGDSVEGIAVPDDVNVIASYPIVVLSDAPHPDQAESFVDFVVSDAGRELLLEYGFGAP